MTSSIYPVNKNRHASLAIQDSSVYEHLQNQHLIPIVFHEFIRLAAEYPLAFVKNAETGRLQAVALLGLNPGENLFFSQKAWRAAMLPASASHYPFMLMPDMFNPEQLVLGINENNSLSGKEGNLLFTVDGQESAWLQSKKQQLAEYYEQTQATQAILEWLVSKKLIKQQVLTFTLNNQSQSINGIYTIDADVLQAMDDSDFLELRKRGLLPSIYAQLASMQQLQKLIQRKVERATG